MEQLTIYLGSRCNLNCAYCHREADEKEPEISLDLLSYIQKKQKQVYVKFMGGEPTLYMRQIRMVTDVAPDARFSICTNGVNLRKHLDFFRRHRFFVCISYDGKDDLRGYDPFTELVDYPWLAVSTTIYHGNTDLREIIRNFSEKERIIGRTLSLFPHIIHETGISNQKYALTKDDADFYVAQYKELVTDYMRDRFRYGVSNKRYEGMFLALYKRFEQPFLYGETYCINRNVKKYDAAGNLYTCLYIRDYKLPKGNWQEEQKKILDTRFPQCRSCTVYDMCGGACIKSTSHETECRIYKELYGWFKDEYPKWRDGKW